MALRFGLILVLLTHQLGLAAASVWRRGDVCLAIECCEVVQRTSCCGEVIDESRCRKTGGECLCAAESDDDQPALPAPSQDNRVEIALTLVAPANVSFDGVSLMCIASLPPTPSVHRTHNETQALLCIWRT